MQTKILIFGTGFIAKNLIKYYQNYKEVQFIVLYNKHKIQTSSAVIQYSMDDDIKKIIMYEMPEYIIALHGNSFVSDNINIEEAINDNVFKISNFLETIYVNKLYSKIKKIIIVGSASEYGKFYNEPIKEYFNLHPTSVYGLSKIFLFNTAKYFIDKDLPIVYVRQFNTIGIGQRENFVVPSFIRNIVLIEKNKKEPILNVGDLNQERDFIDIRDTCKAYDILLQKGAIGEVYNVASGKYISIEFLLEKMLEVSHLSKDSIKIILNTTLFSKEVSLSKRLHSDIDKLEKLGFKAEYTLEDTIKNILEYWRKYV